MKVPSDLLELAQRRAQRACEYSVSPRAHRFYPTRSPHIIGRQHRGTDDVDNLCLSCVRCNLKKGPNIASIDPDTGVLVALYHPRRHAWREHFASEAAGTIKGLTSEGRATVGLLDMNDHNRVQLRALLLRRRSSP